jgi:hypothetical protein
MARFTGLYFNLVLQIILYNPSIYVLLGDTHNTMHVLVVHTHFIEDEEEDISQLSTFVSETFRTFAPKVTTD